MNSKIVLFILLLLTASGRALADPVPDPVTLDVEDMPVAQIFYRLAEFQQVNLVVAPGVSGNLSLRLQQVKWPQAVALVAEMAGVKAVLDGNILRISPEDIPGGQRGEPGFPDSKTAALITRRFVLNNTDVAELLPLLKSEQAGLLTPSGRILNNSRVNMLVVQDTPQAIAKVAAWLNEFDVPLPGIEITAYIVTISEEQLRELGVDWGQGSGTAAGEAGLNIPLAVESPAFSAGMTLTRINGRLLRLELSALEQENQVEIIASPRLITSHGNMASIKQGTEIPYVVSQGKNETATIEFKEAVLGMEITPEVLGGGNVRLTIRLSQNVPGKALQKGNNMPLSIDKQEIETRVTVQDGQTLALGGIFQQNNNQQNKVPWLGDLPVIGALFRNDVSQQTRRELVIFITPRLIFP